MKLIVGNKNYSSWSLRPWLAMKVAGIAFTEQRIPLYLPGSKGEILAFSPAGKVPCLIDETPAGRLAVWDSLSICEYLAEKTPSLWPADPAARALARSISAEMHSGFPNLRTHMSMNIRKRYPDKGRTPEVLAEIARIVAMWSDCRARFGKGGAFLFGPFCNADAMYAPVVMRFRTYEVELPAACRAYADAVALAARDAGVDRGRRSRNRIPAPVRTLRLIAPSMQAYVVGGAVRDELLGLPVVDRDWVVVGATPEDMTAAGYKPVGRDFPVFLHPGTHEEYALARTERKSGRGYKGFTVYTAPDVTLEDDLARRDLTINAMARGADGRLVDPFGGEADASAGVLRHVGEAFAEDPVRILRVARFAARFRFQVAPETLELMRGMVAAGEADFLVAERVWQELARGLLEAHPPELFLVLEACGALGRLAPELQSILDGPLRNALFGALERAAAQGAPLPVRFAILAWFGDETGIDSLGARLRAPMEERELAQLACRYRTAIASAANAGPDALLAVLKGADAFRRKARFEDLLLAAALSAPETAAGAKRLRAALHAAAAIDAGAIAASVESPAEIPGAIDAARLAAVRGAAGA